MADRLYPWGGIAQVHISLLESDPEIWRRILVPRETTLADLHHMIQAAMGWQDSHLHCFNVGGLTYGDLDLLEDETALDAFDVQVGNFAYRGPPFLYLYDFGDSWKHFITIEGFRMKSREEKYPQCIAGERACPPEDVGGVEGYAMFLEAYHDPDHPAHRAKREWIGGRFNSERFNLKKTNNDVRLAVQRASRYGSQSAYFY